MKTGQKIVIRPAREHDIQAMFAISLSTHQDYTDMIPRRSLPRFRRRYSDTAANRGKFLRVMRQRLNNRAWAVVVAEKSGAVVGYCLRRSNGSTTIVRGLFVATSAQGQGIGKLLFESLLRAVRTPKIELKVLKDNTRAIALYEQYGFVQVRRRVAPFFGAPQVVMVRREQG